MDRDSLHDKIEEIQDHNWDFFTGSNEYQLHTREDILDLLDLERNNIDYYLLIEVIKKYGPIKQTWKIHEECLELAQAVADYSQHDSNENYDALIDEIADVKIMMKQTELMFSREDIQKRIDFKLERLRERLK